MTSVTEAEEAMETTRALRRAAPGRAPRVLHLIESLGPGGAERLLYTNLKHLAGARLHSTVVTVFDRGDHWAGPIRELGVPVSSLGCRGFGDLPRGIARLRALLRRERPDLIHTHLWGANVVGRLAGLLGGVPVVSSIHNPDHEPEAWDDGSGVSLSKRLLAREVDRWTARAGCERMIAVSEHVRQSAHRRLRFPVGRIELLYNPVDADAMRAGSGRHSAEVRRECGIEPDALVLLNVGRVSPQKGLLYAIRAMPEIARRFPRARLVSAGETTDRAWLARLEAEARTHGVAERVHYLGPRRDVPDLLRACDLFVFPSLYEGLGIALVEAMVAGLACVATNVGPIPEVIKDGSDGLLVPPADPAALAEAVCLLLADATRREALGRAARESALARFEPRAGADKLLKIYEAVSAAAGRT